MIDTVRFRYLIDEEEKKIIEKIGRRTESYSVQTGEIYYSFTNSNLKGSWDTTIQLKVQEREVVNNIYMYYLYVECSLHKIILGHNCYGASIDLKAQLIYLQQVILKEIRVYIDIDKIIITRIDIAYVYRLLNQKQCISYIKQYHTVPYRNKTPKKYETSVFWKFQNWSIKIYDKLSDFNVHDFKKSNFTVEFYENINGILRVEITYRKKELEKIHKKKNLQVDDININLLVDVFNKKIQYLENFVGNKSEYKKISDFEDVKNRLYNSNLITKRKASTLLNSFNIVRMFGLSSLKSILSNSAYYDHRNLLMQHGIDIINNEVNNQVKKINFKSKLFPEDFRLQDEKYKIKTDDLDCYLQII